MLEQLAGTLKNLSIWGLDGVDSAEAKTKFIPKANFRKETSR